VPGVSAVTAGTVTPKVEARPGGGLSGLLRRNLLLLIGLVISALAIRQLASEVKGPELLGHLAATNWPLVALCFASVPLSMLLKVWRQRYLFGEVPTPAVAPLYSALYIGYLMNTVLPGRVGEFVRAFLIGRQKDIGVPAALTSIVLEKLLDLATLAILLVVLILVTPLPAWATPMAYTSAAAVGAGLVTFGLILVFRRQVTFLVASIDQRVGPLRRLGLAALANSFLDGLAGLGRSRSLPGLIFWSIVVWASSAASLWVGLEGVGVSVGLTGVLLTLVVTNIGMAVPSAPGYAGVFEGLVVLALLPYGIGETQALAAALVLHATVFGNFIVGGLWYLRRGGYSLRGLRDASGH
jgi:uncharacterized protein (TIRG00374 family)